VGEDKIEEAVLVNRDYKYDGKKIHISKKNFKKVHKDYKNDTPGKERMITYDSKWGTVSVPVEFTEEVEAKEKKRPRKKRNANKNNICLSTFLHHFAIKLVFSLVKLNI